ncbi:MULTISPECIES: hypothetical protein [Chryseobacterium]|uniref:Uncharacterized protein n=1 Tax=Chryseobacterium wanjuense TaxID=356305 RepID=A0A1I0S199_9FLAO|nr:MULTISPECIES: hypothetical protein [Chryseobacterium]KYH03730.1 hypothetical protein A1704_20265 [Chryseobacterium cucumeris]SEW47045.1 hypothetical protein SAMN05421841_3421 [Chryseobacterium wanjuense]
MKKLKLIFPVFVFWTGYFQACDACKLQQPKITQDFTHGTGPESNWDWAIVIIIAIITLGTFFYSFKFLIKPNENNKKHIKNNILDF